MADSRLLILKAVSMFKDYKNFFMLVNYFYRVCACICIWLHMEHAWRSEDNPCESVSSFHYVVSRDCIQVVRLS